MSFFRIIDDYNLTNFINIQGNYLVVYNILLTESGHVYPYITTVLLFNLTFCHMCYTWGSNFIVYK